MSSLESINRFVIPDHVVHATDAQLRVAGAKYCECFVLWSGVHDADTFHVRTAHVPRQTAYRLSEGLCVRVEGDELHRINRWLFENHELLAIQVHSHPTDAFHSDTDDTYPIVTARGGLSLVVPDFARAGLRGPGVAIYRLDDIGWYEVPADEASQILQFREGEHGTR